MFSFPSLILSGETVMCNVAWIWASETAASSSSISATGGREAGKECGGVGVCMWGDWPRNLEFFWNGSSKQLPAAYINHPQLAQRGNSICRELRCILFIEELLVIRPYTPSHSKSQATRQEAATCFFYKKAGQSPPTPEKKNSLNESPVSSCVFRRCPVCSAKQGDLC